MMDEPLGAVAKRKRQRRIKVELTLLIFLIIGSIFYIIFTADTSEGGEALEIVVGPGENLEAAYFGPSELQIKWDNVTGNEWSVSLAEGRIRNISSKIVAFEDIVYRVRDEEGLVIWQKCDERFATNGGRLGLMQYFNFAANPITKGEAKRFEVVVQNPTIIER